MLTTIIPAHNEENWLPACLTALVAQTDLPDGHGQQVVVAANGCTDGTVDVAERFRKPLEAKGFRLDVLDLARGNKIEALNAADAVAVNGARAYLDADVVVGPAMLAELARVLDTDAPLYASGTIRIPRSSSPATRAYGRVWTSLPFVADGVPGIGLFAVSAAGRARWAEFPSIIADDRFARLNFAEEERTKVAETYDWPLPDGFWNLVRVRHRWSEGNDEVQAAFPHLEANDRTRNRTGLNALSLLRTPVSSAVFVAVYGLGRLRARASRGRGNAHWNRGR